MPNAVLLLGLPGSGKSSMLRPIAWDLFERVLEPGPVVVDPDVVRSLIPEYAGGLGSEVVHVETSYVTSRLLLDEAYATGSGIVLDKVGHPERTVAEAKYLLEHGWSVWCLCADVEIETAVRRVKERALATGRYVPPELIAALGREPVLAYEALRDSGLDISGCVLVDTNVPQGGRPVVKDARTVGMFGYPGDEVVLWRPWPASEATGGGSGG